MNEDEFRALIGAQPLYPHLGAAQQSKPDWTLPHQLLNAIKTRLHLTTSDKIDFVDHIDARKAGDKIFVWVIKGETAAVIEDGADLFPSDQLVTRLRLLAG
jgi:hypothetical protein